MVTIPSLCLLLSETNKTCSVFQGLIMLKVLLQSLKDPPTIPGDAKYSFVRKLSPDTATHYNFINKEAKFKPPKLNRFANETLSASFIANTLALFFCWTQRRRRCHKNIRG